MSRVPRLEVSGRRNPGLELFFDLVFVLCVARLADVLHEDPTWTTAGHVLLLFVPVWWSWTGVTFMMNRFPDDGNVANVLVLVAATASGLMALAIPTVPGSGDRWFALGYAAVRLVLVTAYLLFRAHDPALSSFYATGFAVVAVLWLVSVALPRPIEPVVWAAAMVLDILVPPLADRRNRMLPVDDEHLPDRFGAFAIIVLGESAVNTVAVARFPLHGAVTVPIAEGFVVAALLWWGFFDRSAWHFRYRALADRDASGRIAYIVCAYLHLPLIVGVTLVGAGVQVAVAHLDEAEHGAARTPLSAALLVTIGIGTYLPTLNVMTRVVGTPRASSLVPARIVLLAALAALLGFGRQLPAWAFLLACVAVLLVHTAVNIRRSRAPD